jgi:cyclophilin family peptidyl-prolyl cis-trans isomerase
MATAVLGLVGVQPRAHSVDPQALAQAKADARCRRESGTTCYGAEELQAAYDLPTLYRQGYSGQGITVAVIENSGSPTLRRDLATYDHEFDLPAPPKLTVIMPNGPTGAFDRSDPELIGWANEEDLDVEAVHTIAPMADILVVQVIPAAGADQGEALLRGESYVLNHHLAQVISQSFGSVYPPQDEQGLLSLRAFNENALQDRVTMIASSGDYGSAGQGQSYGDLSLHPVVSWPASDPLVTGVGGTVVKLGRNGKRTQPDIVWGWGINGASGGGLSPIFSRPGYQSAVGTIVGDHRGTPDISMAAAFGSNGPFYFGPEIQTKQDPGFSNEYGTSGAAALFAGIVAIADQYAGHPLGLINPALYKLYEEHSPGLVDITVGNTGMTIRRHGGLHHLAGWPARRGYDLATGVGTVDAGKFVPALAAASGPSSPAPAPTLPASLTDIPAIPPAPPGLRSAPLSAGCPALNGSSPHYERFFKSPPMCVNPSRTYTATIFTDLGRIRIKLDARHDLAEVNNFVYLAGYHFYDGLSFDHVVTGQFDQSGDTQGPYGPGLGYRLPAGSPATATQAGQVATFNGATPGQFVIVESDQAGFGGYRTRSFGSVTSGMAVVRRINFDGSLTDGGTPNIVHRILKVTVTGTP